MGTGIDQGMKLDLLALQLEWKPRGLDFPFFSGTGSARQICVFSFTDSCLFAMFFSSDESPTPMLSCFCIFLSRLRTRKRHFPQGSRLQKKRMPMRRMSFELLKRYVAHVGPLRFLFKSFGEKLHFLPSFPEWPGVSHSQLLLGGLSYPFQFPFITSHEENHKRRSVKQLFDSTTKTCLDIIV